MEQDNNYAQDRSFADFGIRGETVESLRSADITHPFEIQALTLPSALSGTDIIGQAKTGTGKTFAFGIPILERLNGSDEKGRSPRAVIILPTRELALQVEQELKIASTKRTDNITIALFYGGQPFEYQIEQLSRGVDIVVGTPGRLIDLVKRGNLSLSKIEILVLDEADVMLNFGFIDDIEKLITNMPPSTTEDQLGRQTLLFSATMPGEIVLLARKYMNSPIHISAIPPDELGATVTNIDNFAYRAHPLDKPELLAKMLQSNKRGKTIIFARMKSRASRLCDDLQARGFNAKALHGDLPQIKREKTINWFKTNFDENLPPSEAPILVATDVAARGIDVEGVTHVFNYESPDDETTYLHRTGRTGRAGLKGAAITFVDWEDMARWKMIANALSITSVEPVETYSSGKEWREELDVPDDVKGSVGPSLFKGDPNKRSISSDNGRDPNRWGGGRKSGGQKSGGRNSGSQRSGGQKSGDRKYSGAKRSSKSDDQKFDTRNSSDRKPRESKPKRNRIRKHEG